MMLKSMKITLNNIPRLWTFPLIGMEWHPCWYTYTYNRMEVHHCHPCNHGHHHSRKCSWYIVHPDTETHHHNTDGDLFEYTKYLHVSSTVPKKNHTISSFWKLTPLDSSVWHILHPKATSSSSLLGQSESPSHSQTLGMQRKVDVHRNSVGLQVRSGSKLKQTNKHLIKYSTHFFILECKTLKSFYWNLNTDISTILIQ